MCSARSSATASGWCASPCAASRRRALASWSTCTRPARDSASRRTNKARPAWSRTAAISCITPAPPGSSNSSTRAASARKSFRILGCTPSGCSPITPAKLWLSKGSASKSLSKCRLRRPPWTPGIDLFETFARCVAFKPGKGSNTMNFRAVCPSAAFLLFAGLLPAADPQLVSLLMPDAKVVAGINVEQARNSPLGQFMLAHMQRGDEGFAKLAATTGFDPRRDLHEVLMGTIGRPGQQGLVLARGTFDAARIFAAARLGGHTVETYNGVDILTGKDDALTHAVTFLDGSIAVAGDLASVHGAVDRHAAANGAI